MPSTFKTLILALLITFSFLAVSKVGYANQLANSSLICDILISNIPSEKKSDGSYIPNPDNQYAGLQKMSDCPDGASLLVYFFSTHDPDYLVVNQWMARYCNINHPSDYKEHIYENEAGGTKLVQVFSFYCIKQNKKEIKFPPAG